jgi:hypothetical protein
MRARQRAMHVLVIGLDGQSDARSEGAAHRHGLVDQRMEHRQVLLGIVPNTWRTTKPSSS